MRQVKIRPCFTLRAIALAVAMSAFPCAKRAPANQNWDNTTDQKVWGLMQVWGTVKYNFVFFDQVPDLDWDAAVRTSIPYVLAAENRDRRLNELTALLHDAQAVSEPKLVKCYQSGDPTLERGCSGEPRHRTHRAWR